MNFKIDTKEKFCVIRIKESIITDIVADKLNSTCQQRLENETLKNTILDFSEVTEAENALCDVLYSLQQLFYVQQVSLVSFGLSKSVINQFSEYNDEQWEAINYTPTESEAWDIVQMEEIEREYLD